MPVHSPASSLAFGRALPFFASTMSAPPAWSLEWSGKSWASKTRSYFEIHAKKKKPHAKTCPQRFAQSGARSKTRAFRVAMQAGAKDRKKEERFLTVLPLVPQ